MVIFIKWLFQSTVVLHSRYWIQSSRAIFLSSIFLFHFKNWDCWFWRVFYYKTEERGFSRKLLVVLYMEEDIRCGTESEKNINVGQGSLCVIWWFCGRCDSSLSDLVPHLPRLPSERMGSILICYLCHGIGKQQICSLQINGPIFDILILWNLFAESNSPEKVAITAVPHPSLSQPFSPFG